MTSFVACTSADRRPGPAAVDELLSPSEVDIVLIADGSSRTLTIYDDGWATLHRSAGPFINEDDYDASDHVLQLDRAHVDRVRARVGDPGFLGAESDYVQPYVHDGGATIFAAGAPPRRITVVNRPSNLPGALADLQREAEAISRQVQAQGPDPFDDPTLPARARILLRYDWWGAGFGGADRLTVFDDGLLEYRRTSSALAPDPDEDSPTPAAILRRVDPGELGVLRGLVSSRTVTVLPLLAHGRAADADSHHFRVRGTTIFRHAPRELEPPLRRIVDEVMRVLEPLRAEA